MSVFSACKAAHGSLFALMIAIDLMRGDVAWLSVYDNQLSNGVYMLVPIWVLGKLGGCASAIEQTRIKRGD